ncbi:MAG: hypothetical protein AAF438_13015, partial [Pseudomonadota bacterium]
FFFLRLGRQVCLSVVTLGSFIRHKIRCFLKELKILWIFAMVCLSSVTSGQELTSSQYELNYYFVIEPKQDRAKVRIELGERADRVVELRLRLGEASLADLKADGELEIGSPVIWQPPEEGGSLTYSVPLTHKRSDSGYDAYVAEDWAIFRGDDLVPAISARTKAGYESRAKLFFELPDAWSVVTPFRPSRQGGYYVVNDKRRFHRPVGWMMVGQFGQRIGEIKGIRVVIAAPKDQGFRRMDTLAFMQWNMTELKKIFPKYPNRLLILGAGNPMWRGGLSGPRSLFMHSDRPMISENGTSSLMHEIVHTALRVSSDEDDWIVEGLAEFYSLEIMRRSKTLSRARFNTALNSLKKWGKDVESLRGKQSKGPVTARAVGVFYALDKELRKKSGKEYSLDDVARTLAEEGGKVSLDQLRNIAESYVDEELKSLSVTALPGIED